MHFYNFNPYLFVCLDFPIAISFPHFMNSDPGVIDRIEGMKPDYEKHHSYIYVEPVSVIKVFFI